MSRWLNNSKCSSAIWFWFLSACNHTELGRTGCGLLQTTSAEEVYQTLPKSSHENEHGISAATSCKVYVENLILAWTDRPKENFITPSLNSCHPWCVTKCASNQTLNCRIVFQCADAIFLPELEKYYLSKQSGSPRHLVLGPGFHVFQTFTIKMAVFQTWKQVSFEIRASCVAVFGLFCGWLALSAVASDSNLIRHVTNLLAETKGPGVSCLEWFVWLKLRDKKASVKVALEYWFNCYLSWPLAVTRQLPRGYFSVRGSTLTILVNYGYGAKPVDEWREFSGNVEAGQYLQKVTLFLADNAHFGKDLLVFVPKRWIGIFTSRRVVSVSCVE